MKTMVKVIDFLVKPPFYRLCIIAVILFLLIAVSEETGYWIGGVSMVVYGFLLVYARLFKEIKEWKPKE